MFNVARSRGATGSGLRPRLLRRLHRHHPGAFIGTVLVFGLAFGSFAAPVAVVRAATPVCVDSGPASNAYTVTACISAPADAATVSGDQTVTGTINVTGTNPGISKAVFFLRGSYLLTDYSNPYTFTLSTTDFVDGTAVLEIEADMRDGFASTHAPVGLTFNNGITTPPVNTKTFTPKTPAPAAGAGQPLIVAAAGDGASGEPNETTATNIIAGWNPDMMLYLGDVYEKGTLTEFKNWYGNSSSFYGRFKSKTNPVVGNHEYEGNAAPGYFNYWDNIPHFYSYNDNGWHFIALDSTSQFNETTPGTAQFDWLQQDLIANQQPCTIAYFHHPTFTVGPQGNATRMDQIWAMFNTYGVDIVLNGHDHDYQRWLPLDANGNPSPSGVTEFVVGTGGHGLQSFVKTDPRMVKGFDTAPAGIGALKLALGAGSATYAFQTAAGVQDSGSISCAPGTGDTTPPTKPGNLTASPLGANRVDLNWTPATDNVGVATYDITRNSQFLCSVPGSATSYSDTTAAPSTTYTYTIAARDLAGNAGPPSDPAQATTGTGSGLPVYSDDFESGNLSTWTNTGMVVQTAEVYAGANAARATTTSAAAWAWHTITNQTNAYYRLRFKIVSLGPNNVYLLKVRTGTGTSIGGLYVDSSNRLNYRNDAGAVTVNSPRTVSLGAWHEIQVHYVIGTTGQIETWLDGVKVTELSKTDNFGTTAIGRIQIADNSGSRAFDLAIDDVVVDTQFISSGGASDTTPPSAPGNLTATAVDSNQIDLDWSPSIDNSGVVAYDVFRSGDLLDSVLGSSTSYSDTTVDPGATYTYTVVARDAAGNNSNASAGATVTAPAAVPGAPTGLAATGGDAHVDLSWTAPASNGGASITGYKVYRSTTSGGETVLASPVGTGTTYTDTTAANGTQYFYKVAAVNSAGTGALSAEAFATPASAVTVPGAPTALTLTPGDSQIGLVWTAPASNGGSPITAYKVYRGTTSGGESLVATLGNVTSYTDTLLTNGTTYFYDVTAVNTVGEGLPSSEKSGTPASAPGVPTGVNATASAGQVALSWTAPSSDGGSPITKYNIWRSTTAGAETLFASTTTAATSYTDQAVANGTTYYYKVAAVTAVSTGNVSAEASGTPLDKPGAPTALTLTPGDSQVGLSWTAPASNGGSPITAYKVYRGTTSGGESAVATLGNVTSYTDTLLTNGTTYFYKVTAVNAQGEGVASTEKSATPGAVPGVPTSLVATPGNSQVSLSWVAPSNNGSAITGYEIWRGPTAGGSKTKVTTTVGTGTSYTNTGLTNGTAYYYEVAAVNAIGPGGHSAEATATPLAVPGAPTGLAAARGNAQVGLSWTAPASNGGSAITAYKVYRSTTTNTEALVATLGNVTSYTDTSLTNGTTYFYKVSAVNGAGESALSAEASATPATTPGVPGSFAATAGAGQVALSWTAATGNGASVTGYKVYRATSSGGETVLTTLGNVTGYMDSAVTAGLTYFYQVTAVNAVGESSRTSEASATPTAPPALLTADFESGNMTGWTVSGPIAASSASPHLGSWDARAQCVGAACWAYRPFASSQTATDLYLQTYIYVQTRDTSTTVLLKLRTGSSGSGASVFGLQLNNKGKLSYRNDVTAKTTTGNTVFAMGTWHRVTIHLTAATAGHVDVWVDGVKDTTLSKNDNFGTAAIAKLQLGENSSGGNFDVSFDDISASTASIAP